MNVSARVGRKLWGEEIERPTTIALPVLLLRGWVGREEEGPPSPIQCHYPPNQTFQ